MKTLIKTLQALTVVTVLVIAISMTFAAKQAHTEAPAVGSHEQAIQQETDTLKTNPVTLQKCPDQMC